MKLTQVLLPLLFSSLVIAAPSPTIEKRATTICGQWDSVVTGTYTIYQNLWGESAASSGSQCTTVNSDSGTTLAWSTSWTWAGGSSSVKSFANAVVKQSARQVSNISSLKSTWKWSYTGTNIVADVAWLAALGGAGPISSTGTTVATPTIAGVSWKLYYGLNGSTKVYSFVASSQTTNFSGDVLLFFKYLESSFSYPSSQYLLSVGAGTEPFTGSNAVFTTSAYSFVIA